MTVFFAGNEVELFTSFNGTVSTNANVAISGVNRAGVSFLQLSQVGVINFPEQSEGWVHFRHSRINAVARTIRTPALSLRNSSDVSLVDLRAYASNANDAWVSIRGGADVALPTGSVRDVDIHYKIAASGGFVKVYADGVLITEVSGNTSLSSGAQTVSRMRMAGLDDQNIGTSQNLFSQFLVADTPTLGARVHTLPLTVGATNQWDGTPANVTGTASAGAISETTADEEISFTAADFGVALQSGFALEAVVLSSYAQALSGSPVTKVQGRSRIGGTPYSSGGLITLASGYALAQQVMAINPATSASWTVAEVNAAEFGLQAKP